ncbi:MAG TPA: DUF2891 family protein [Planctomycetota bacterium]|nr:DUF2891 family protein [Planctomycetota bacterium]
MDSSIDAGTSGAARRVPWRPGRALVPLVLVTLPWLAPRSGRGADATEEPVRNEHATFLATLVPTVRAGIARKDTEHPVFHGCFDWHSAVHGHWALLRIARTTAKHADAALAVDASLTGKGIEAEARMLAENGEFEMPYGRAWFLRLASEFARWSREGTRKDPDRLRPMADAVAASLDDYLKRREPGPSPETPEYANDAWALAQLHAWYAFVGDHARRQRIECTVCDRFLGAAEDVTFASDRARPEFFSRFGNWAYLVAQTQSAPVLARFLETHRAASADLAPVEPTGETAHHLGMNWSRAWALKSLAARAPEAQRRVLLAAYDAHVAAGKQEHAKFAGDYGAYDHWVPQFAVYALTDETGR